MGSELGGWRRDNARWARGRARSGEDWIRWVDAEARRVCGEGEVWGLGFWEEWVEGFEERDLEARLVGRDFAIVES